MSVKHAFENLEEAAKDGIVDELLNQGPIIFGEVAKNQWGSYCIQHSMPLVIRFLDVALIQSKPQSLNMAPTSIALWRLTISSLVSWSMPLASKVPSL